MADVSIRDLRNHGGEVVARVQAGEQVTITKSGQPVAELVPLRRRGLDGETLISRWAKLPPVDPERFRRDLDELIDSSI
jgi:prevent-host-death family protein